jgi:hypothetical protein
VLRGAGYTWSPSLPKWGVEVTVQPALRTILLPMDVSLESESLVQEGSSLLGCQAFFGGVTALWAHMSPGLIHPMGSGAGFILPLFGGEKAPEVVYLAPVEKVRVLRGDRVGHVC